MPRVDSQLFRQAQKGNRRAFRNLISPFRGLIYSVAYGMHKSHSLAQSHLREVQRKAFGSISNLHNPANLPRWLYSLTHCHVQEHQRLAPQSAPKCPEAPAQSRSAICSEQMEWAWGDLALPHRVVLGMKYTNDYTPRELADILGISTPSAKERLFEARKQMRWSVLRYLQDQQPPKSAARRAKRTDWAEVIKRWSGPPTREEESVVKRLFSWHPAAGAPPSAAWALDA
jgi:DNA-directed RNA polymerase specialized sigma24 family protein